MKSRSPFRTGKPSRFVSSFGRSSRRSLFLEPLEDRHLLAFGDTIFNFPGPAFDPNQAVFPPDTNGDIGLNHYVAAVNATPVTLVAVYDKHTGGLVAGPFGMAQFHPAGSRCRNNSAGDPVVIYDDAANRWVITEFAVSPTGAADLCVLVSQNSDPTAGAWFAYQFATEFFPDYPKYSFGPNGYFVTTNENGGTPNPAVYAFDRENMLQGLPARPFLRFDAPALPGFGFQALTPVQPEGNSLPPGSPALFMRHVDDELHFGAISSTDTLEIFAMHVDFASPRLSTFDLVQSIAVADFDSSLCNAGGTLSCVPQPGVPDGLDAIPQLLMSRVHLRNFGTHTSIVGSFTVQIPKIPDNASVRWFELRRPNNGSQFALYQEGVVDNTPDNEFMPSIAIDGNGNIAVLYNISSATRSPSLRYAGHRFTDPLGVMSLGPIPVVNGRGAQLGVSRWGDYASLDVDPINANIFWGIGTFIDTVGFQLGSWATQVVAFTFGDPPPPPPPPLPPNVSLATITGTKFHDKNGDGVRTLDEPGLENMFVFADLDNDFRPDINEPSALTNRDGHYQFLVTTVLDTLTIREQAPPGWTTTFPNPPEYTLTMDPALKGTGIVQHFIGIDFGNSGQLFDFGDAPTPYPVNTGKNGARHGILAGFRLGSSLDGEADGANSTGGNGDNDDGAADEDGVHFTSLLAAGRAVGVDVDVQLNGHSLGRLQGFVDFNQDGDWDDAAEQIFTNVKLNEGIHSLTFQVPAIVVPGLTLARFRYGYEFGIGPTGPALAGEVEDYQVLVLGPNPDALDDNFTVDQDSSANVLNVLVNDLPSANGNPKVVSVGSTLLPGAVVQVAADGLSIIYSPPIRAFGIDRFTYTVDDGLGGRDTATVTVSIIPTFPNPIAIDDHFTNGIGGPNVLAVLANDIVGANGPISIQSITQPTNGTATIAPGGLAVIYTPSAGFSDLDQFTYTITDQNGMVSVAMVSVQVQQPNASADDIVAFSFAVTDTAGNAISTVPLGSTFLLHVFADDLRTADPNPGTPADDRGVFAAYLDILYDSTRTVVQSIRFSPECATCLYPNVTSANFSIPNIINDAGGTQASSQGLGPNPTEVFTVVLQAINAGSLTFQGDPTAEFPTFDTLTFEPPQPVPIDQITYGKTTITIVGAGTPPRAIDDTFAAGTTALNVLANDILGTNGQVTVVAVGTPTAGGAVQIAGGGTSLTYTAPATGASNQFTYTIRDSAGLTATAVATVQGNPADDLINLRIEARTLSGTVLDGGSLSVGDKFNLNVYVDDLRAADPIPGTAADDRGVFAAYLDVLYNRGLVSVDPDATNPLGFDITCGPAFTNVSTGLCNGASGNAGTPGLINETGAFQVGSGPLGANEFLLYTVQMTATAAGAAVFRGDPADIRSEVGPDPDHDSLLFEPPQPVGISRIRYGSTTFNIVAGSPEGENTNPRNPLDVNNDGRVSPVDALLGASKLNRDGAGPLGGNGEGEAAVQNHYYYDVNGDGFHSPIDILRVVSYLNRPHRAAGEAGGSTTLRAEGESSARVSSSIVSTSSASNNAVQPSVSSGSAVTLGSALLSGSPRRGPATTDAAPIAAAGSFAADQDEEPAVLHTESSPARPSRRPALEPLVAVSSVEELLTDDLVADVASAWGEDAGN